MWVITRCRFKWPRYHGFDFWSPFVRAPSLPSSMVRANEQLSLCSSTHNLHTRRTLHKVPFVLSPVHILHAKANAKRIWRECDVTTLLSQRYSQGSRAEFNFCELFVANLWRQHSLRIRIRRKYEPGFNHHSFRGDTDFLQPSFFIYLYAQLTILLIFL